MRSNETRQLEFSTASVSAASLHILAFDLGIEIVSLRADDWKTGRIEGSKFRKAIPTGPFYRCVHLALILVLHCAHLARV